MKQSGITSPNSTLRTWSCFQDVHGEDYSQGTGVEQYILSLYFVLTTILTVRPR